MNPRIAALLERYAPPILGGILILLAWEFLPAFFHVSKLLLPPPSSVVRSLWLI
jgi:NitT/TauT family transport system permease protein